MWVVGGSGSGSGSELRVKLPDEQQTVGWSLVVGRWSFGRLVGFQGVVRRSSFVVFNQVGEFTYVE